MGNEDTLTGRRARHVARLSERAAPQRVEPQRLEHPHTALHVTVGAQESGVAGQHLRRGDRQRPDQRRDVVADGVGGAGAQLVFDDLR